MTLSSIRWEGDARGQLVLLDQTRLPGERVELVCTQAEQVMTAIRTLAVRGAPAIGVAAAYGLVLAMRDVAPSAWATRLEESRRALAATRPTAVNLAWALDRAARAGTGGLEPLFHTAVAIEREDREMCAAIGRHGAPLLAGVAGVLTHCNAGSLATAGTGTALAVIYAAHAAGPGIHVYVDETRPLLQGSRLTAWELMANAVPATLICDSMAGWVMKQGRVQAVITGADRIAANGDSANKIGTYSVALLARAHGIPFYVAAPSSTFDLSLADGSGIPIEERAGEEITEGFGRRTAPAGVATYSPAFDVTPAELITAIICERGVIDPVTGEGIAAVLG